MKLEDMINENYQSLNDTDRHILHIVIKNKSKIPEYTLNEFSELCATSTTTIHRTLRKLGFQGFSDFKYAMSRETVKNTLVEVDYQARIANNIALTLNTFKDEDLQKLFTVMDNANKIYSFGTGWKQSSMLQNFGNDMITMKKGVIQIQSLIDLKNIINSMEQGDVCFVVSLSGNTEGVDECIRIMNLKGVLTVSLTLFGVNNISKAASMNFYFTEDYYDIETMPWPAQTLKIALDFIVHSYAMHMKLI